MYDPDAYVDYEPKVPMWKVVVGILLLDVVITAAIWYWVFA